MNADFEFLPRLARRPARAAAALAAVAGAVACDPPPPRIVEPPYQPRYAYSAKRSAGAEDITIAIAAAIPKKPVRGSDGKAMVEALPIAFQELITAKGMKYRGPFEVESVKDCEEARQQMTYPDKQGSDLMLCTELNVEAGWQLSPGTFRPEAGDPVIINGIPQPNGTCTITIAYEGKVLFKLLEPLTGETLWTKHVTLARHEASEVGMGATCLSQPREGEPSPIGPIGNQYRRGLEQAFWEIMKGLDRHISVDEMVDLKRQTQELRQKKVYTK